MRTRRSWRTFTANEGYIDFEIKDIKITNPTPRTMKIEFVIEEGNLYKVGTRDIQREPPLQHE